MDIQTFNSISSAGDKIGDISLKIVSFTSAGLLEIALVKIKFAADLWEQFKAVIILSSCFFDSYLSLGTDKLAIFFIVSIFVSESSGLNSFAKVIDSWIK